MDSIEVVRLLLIRPSKVAHLDFEELMRVIFLRHIAPGRVGDGVLALVMDELANQLDA